MILYKLLFIVPIHGFVHRIFPIPGKHNVLHCGSNDDVRYNQNVNDFSTTIINPPEQITESSVEDIPDIINEENTRTGKFVDQDGKNNVWAVDPPMKVSKINSNNISLLLNILTGIGMCSTIIYMLSQIFPDYDSF